MEIDKVITLKNGKKYLLLLESELTLEGYYLAVLLDDNEEPTNNYTVLQEITKNGKVFTKKIDDALILNELLADYRSQYEDILEEEQDA